MDTTKKRRLFLTGMTCAGIGLVAFALLLRSDKLEWYTTAPMKIGKQVVRVRIQVPSGWTSGSPPFALSGAEAEAEFYILIGPNQPGQTARRIRRWIGIREAPDELMSLWLGRAGSAPDQSLALDTSYGLQNGRFEARFTVCKAGIDLNGYYGRDDRSDFDSTVEQVARSVVVLVEPTSAGE
jgi:hypothetical protein